MYISNLFKYILTNIINELILLHKFIPKVCGKTNLQNLLESVDYICAYI